MLPPRLVKAGKVSHGECLAVGQSTAGTKRWGAPGSWLGALSLLAFAFPADAAKSTYDRRLWNKTSVVIVFYRLGPSGWVEPRIAWPGLPVEDKDVPKRTEGSEVFGADLGNDGRIELARRDFGVRNFHWTIGENFPK